MISVAEARKLAMSFSGTVERPHFDRASFRANDKRIFMTLKEDEQLAVLMLSPEDQSVFIKSPDGAVYPVPNKWGQGGATIFNLKKVKKGLFKDALNCAFQSKLNPPSGGSRKS
ncbi:MAG: MmcQ/YjbR family DNA-binding protein [Bacteroidota bacterium]